MEYHIVIALITGDGESDHAFTVVLLLRKTFAFTVVLLLRKTWLFYAIGCSFQLAVTSPFLLFHELNDCPDVGLTDLLVLVGVRNSPFQKNCPFDLKIIT